MIEWLSVSRLEPFFDDVVIIVFFTRLALGNLGQNYT